MSKKGTSRPQGLPKKAARLTLFDSMPVDQANQNMFCHKNDLSNEASVEKWFMDPLIAKLGYKGATQVKTKASLDTLTIPSGVKAEKHKPDYVLYASGKPRIVLDAKATNEPVDKYVYQAGGYAYSLNSKFGGSEKPIRYFVLSNGFVTKVFEWDDTMTPILVLDFEDFREENAKWADIYNLLNVKTAAKGWKGAKTAPKGETITLKRPESMDAVKRLFARCHRIIWNAQSSKSPSAAFFEFVKLMFVKTWQDRELHNDKDLGPLVEKGKPVPAEKVPFSVRWIESMEKLHESPVDAVLFQSQMGKLEELVERKEKKRIFPKGERIKLAPATIKAVVAEMESVDLWGIDEDLNGRLFETFLNAAMRGQELGQYFTPRTIVKFMTRFAALKAGPDHVDKVIDACCGSGGFLIEVLTEMRNQVRENESLTPAERQKLQKAIAEESIFGMDSGDEPPITRIARINMYLHGDGGSRIYAVDALDKEVLRDPARDVDEQANTDELRRLLTKEKLQFNVALTNPPFSRTYSLEDASQARVLSKYDMAHRHETTSSGLRPSLRSNAMFMERYHDLLLPGGRLITVIDDAILSGPKHASTRKWLRDHFIVRAVISLPGDAFFRSGARVKTSILYLTKKTAPTEEQPHVFMAESIALGLDDLPVRTPPTVREHARRQAEKEAESILRDFAKFKAGKKGPWRVPPERIKDRFDVKHCLPRASPAQVLWSEQGIKTAPMHMLVEPAGTIVKPRDAPTEPFTFLEVGYDGIPRPGESRLGWETTYPRVMRAEPDNLVVSHINAVNGAIGVMPKGMESLVLSPEYTVLRVKNRKETDPMYLWAVLRSPEIIADLLSDARGGGRTRVNWDKLKNMEIPVADPKEQKRIGDILRQSYEAIQKAASQTEAAVSELQDRLALRNESALRRMKAAKPPS